MMRVHLFGDSQSPAEPCQRLRTFLIVAMIATMPINIVFGDQQSASATNMSVSDLFLPVGIALLGWLMLKGRLLLPMITLCLLSLSSTVGSILYNLDTYFRNGQTLRIAIELGKVSCLWLIFYLFINLIRTRSDLLLLIKVWVLASVVEALCGIGGSLLFQFAGIETQFSEAFRAQGTLNDSNLFAAHLGAGVLLTLLYRRLSRSAPVWSIPAIGVLAVGIYFSASRGGLLSFGVALLVLWLVAASRQEKLVSAAVGLGVLVLAVWLTSPGGPLASSPITERLRTTTTSLNDPEAQQRVGLWRAALGGFSESPALGVGSGNFAYVQAGGSAPGGRAHNTYLEILCENGLAGFLAYALFLLAVLSKLLPTERSGRGSGRWAANGILFTALVLVGLAGLTISIENYRGLWILLALVVAYHRVYASTSAEPVRAPVMAELSY
jgi:O-antigen ligase